MTTKNYAKHHAAIASLLIVSVLSLLPSCGDSGAAPDTQRVTDQTDTAAETAAEPSYLDQYDGIDYNQDTYTLAVLSTSVLPNYGGEENTGEPVNDAQYARDIWIEEHYNVALDYVVYPSDGVMVKYVIKQVRAGDTAYDCLQAGMNKDITPMSKGDALADLYSIDGLDLTQEWWSQSFNRAFTVADKLFISTGPIAFSYFYSPRLIAYNLRLAADYGIGDLYALVDEGKWTLDAMYDMIKDFAADLNGDGKMTEDDLWGASIDEYSAAGFFLSAGGTELETDENGKPYFVIQNERNVEIIEKVASIVGNGTMTHKAETLNGKFGNGIADKVYTFKNGNALFLGYGAQAIAFYLRDMEDDYGIIPVPKYDESQDEYITVGNPYVPAYICIPMNNDRGEMNGVILNTMGYISRRDVQPLISDVMLKGKAARDEASHRMLDLIYHDMYLDLNCSYDFGGSFVLLRDVTMGKKDDFVSRWKKLENRANAALDKLYEQYTAIEAEG